MHAGPIIACRRSPLARLESPLCRLVGGGCEEPIDRGRAQPTRFARLQVARELNGAVTNPHQAIHFDADRLPEAPDLPVAALMQDHPEGVRAGGGAVIRPPPGPGWAVRPACGLDPIKAGRAVLQLHPEQELGNGRGPRPPPEPYQIFALDL